MPEASIVIRTYNEEKRLGNLLEALKEQTYRDYEVIIVDSGSTDRTLEIARKFAVSILEIPSRDFTFGYALNVGCKAARGNYLVFVSAHVLPMHRDWLKNLVAPFAEKKVAMVYGKQRGTAKSKFSERRDFIRLFKDSAKNSHVPLFYANNANSAIRRSLWEEQSFDEYLFGLEDIAWARAMTTKGHVIHYEPSAGIYHIHLETWPQVYNRYRREAIAAVRIGLSEPPQAKLGVLWAVIRVLGDLVAASPRYSRRKLEEIFRFRYLQWQGSRVGWRQGRTLDFAQERHDVFYPVTNTGVVISGRHQASLEEIPLPEMRPGDLLIKIAYVGICRTDLEVLEGSLGYYRDGVAQYPIVPGHEFSGTVARIGSNNRLQERFAEGDKVVGECILSRDPAHRQEVGVINYNGAYSEYVLIPGDAVHKVPQGLELSVAALTEPTAVVLRAIRRIRHRLTLGARVAVTGAGMIGHVASRVLALEGYEVTAFDANVARLSLLAGIASRTSSSLDRLDEYDVIIEATGSRDVLERVVRESKSDVTLMLLGFPYGDMQYNFEDLVGHEKVFAGSIGGDAEDFDTALSLLPRFSFTPQTFAVLPLAEFEHGWELHRASTYLKVLLQP